MSEPWHTDRWFTSPFEDTVLTLLTMYGQDLGIRTERLFEPSKLVTDLAGVTIPSNRPIVGEQLYNVESGIIATWVRNAAPDHLLECAPYLPELVGQHPITPVLGKGSGIDSIAVALDKIGLEATTEVLQELLLAVEARSLETKTLVGLDEFAAMAEGVLGRTAAGPSS